MRHTRLFILLLAALATLAAACGQKGPLRLPPEPPKNAAAPLR